MGELIGKLGGILDRSFVMAYWAPVFISIGYLALAVVLQLGFGPVIRAWTRLGTVDQIVLAAAALVALTVLAYVLEAFTGLVIRTYEGYTRVTRILNGPAAGPTPGKAGKRRLTRLGKAIHSGEQHSRDAYELESVFWWPRLYLVLPDVFKQQMSGFFTPMVGLLNLCTGMALASALGSCYLALTDGRWWLAALIFAGGTAFARGCYEGAVRDAEAYGRYFSVAFDLYRHDLLKQMGIFRPTNFLDEVWLWWVLETWLRCYEWPDARSVVLPTAYGPAPAWMQDNFYYSGKVPDAAETSKPPPAAGRVTIDYEVKGPPTDGQG